VSVTHDELAAAKLGRQERDNFIDARAGIASLDTQLKAANCQIGNHLILRDRSNQLANLHSACENIGQMKVNFERIIEIAMRMKAKDEQSRSVAGSEPKASQGTDRKSRKHWEVVAADQDGILLDTNWSEKKKDANYSPVLSSQSIHLRERRITLLGFSRNDESEVNGWAKCS
jgi:hypothetical protein